MSFRPLFLAVPTALVAAAGFAWLTTATASNGGLDSAPQVAQAATPPTASPPAASSAAGGQMQRPPFSPQKMCIEHVSRKLGMRAYLKSRLDLKPEQMAAWNTFEKASDDVSTKDKARCGSLPVELKSRPNFTDRFTMRENFMKSRLDSVEAVKPSLMALYTALTPEQKEILDRPMMHGGHHHHGPHNRG